MEAGTSKISIHQFVQESTDYYQDQFDKLSNKEGVISWNWPAFFLSNLWCFYRKLYVPGIIITLVYLLLDVVQILLEMGLPFLVTLIINVVIGLLANSIYMDYVHRHMAIADTLDEEPALEYVRKKGGTSAYLILALVVVQIFIVIVVAVLFVLR